MSREQVKKPQAGQQSSETVETEDQPELRPSESRKSRHRPDAYTVGYDSTGDTRVGVGAGSTNSRLERLIRHNEGRHQSDGNHSSREAERDKKRITQSFCSSLDVTPLQQQEAVSVMGQLNLNRFGRQKRLEKVAIGVIRFVVDRDRHRYFYNGRDPSSIDLSKVDEADFPDPFGEEEGFQKLCESHGMSKKDQYSLSQLVKREIKRIGHFEDESAREEKPQPD